jgi:inosine-uridine nucleoside N-ribohydrolase
MEYNLGSDAEASVAALTAGIPTTIVPLDATWQVRLRDKELARLRRSRSALVQTLCDAMEIWWPVHRDLFAGKRTYGADVVCFLHDPLALSLLIDPSFVALTTMRLVPEIADGLFRLRRDPRGREFQVATRVDAPAFVEFLVERLLRLE